MAVMIRVHVMQDPRRENLGISEVFHCSTHHFFHIRITFPFHIYPFIMIIPHFCIYIANQGYAGLYRFFLIFAPKHRL